MIKNFFLKPSLNKKLVAMMLFLSLSLISILIFLYYRTEKTMYNEFERRTAELTKAIQAGLSDAIGRGMTDESKLQGYLKELKVRGVKEISIISTSDKIISSTSPEMVGKWITKRKKELIVKAELGEPVTEKDKIYNIMIPVIVGEKHMGYINLTITADDFTIFLQANIIRRIIAALAVFLIGIILAVFLARRYTKPIEDIVDAAQKVASGDLDQELRMERKDEIGDLARSFNYMVGHLREERQLRERLRKAEHLASMGQFSRIVAHEIKNPLNFISLSIDHIKELYRPGEKEKAEKFEYLLANMKSEIHRVGRFASSFLEYGKPLELNLRMTEAGKLLNGVLELVSAKAKTEGINIVKDFKAEVELEIDPELIRTCLYNIIINAFQSMPDGGTLTIKTDCVNKNFVISVEDTGAGIAGDKIGKVFDPFFTTKKDGLGLGLPLSKRVIEEHGGKISFQSVEGKGSTVSIILCAGQGT